MDGAITPVCGSDESLPIERFAPRIAPCLQFVVGRKTTNVLPSLENIFLEGHEPSGPVQDGTEQFVAARLAHGRPITVTRWERHDDGDYDEESYDIDDNEEGEGEGEDED